MEAYVLKSEEPEKGLNGVGGFVTSWAAVRDLTLSLQSFLCNY